MASAELFQYFNELANFLATGCIPSETNSLETISRHTEDHISIIASFAVLINNDVHPNIAERTLCVLLEGLYESLTDMFAEITVQLDVDGHVQRMGTHSDSQRGRPR